MNDLQNFCGSLVVCFCVHACNFAYRTQPLIRWPVSTQVEIMTCMHAMINISQVIETSNNLR